MQAEEEFITETHLETEAALWEQLAQCGWSLEEILAFLWLRRRYQTGGSDRMKLLRHWKFLKWLIRASLREEEQERCKLSFLLSDKLSEERFDIPRKNWEDGSLPFAYDCSTRR
jgi:hypothetical protein